MDPQFTWQLVIVALGAIGYFIARELTRVDRTSDRQGRFDGALKSLATEVRMMREQRADPLLLRQEDRAERADFIREQGQQAIAFDLSKVWGEMGKLRGEMGTLEADVKGQISTAMGEVRATINNINDRIAAMSARQSDYDQAQRQILDKMNEMAVAIARIEARFERQPDAISYPAPPMGGLRAGDRQILDALRALATQGAPS